MENKNADGNNKNLFTKLKDWVKGQHEHNPLKDAREMASAFREDLKGRLEIIVSENDAKHVRFQINPHYVEETKTSELSVRVFMKLDEMQYPQGVAQQILNAFWGTENDKQHKGKFTVRTLKDTIAAFKNSFGTVKFADKQGYLTTQKKYTFK